MAAGRRCAGFLVAGLFLAQHGWSAEGLPAGPSEPLVEAEAGLLAGSVHEGFGEDGSRRAGPASGSSLGFSARGAVSERWYARVAASQTSFAGEQFGRALVVVGMEAPRGEAAVGLGVFVIRTDRRYAVPLPAFHVRAGGRHGLQAAVSLFDDRSPVHGLASAGVGYKGRNGTELAAGYALAEDYSMAPWLELRSPAPFGVVGIYVARGRADQEFDTDWFRVGMRVHVGPVR